MNRSERPTETPFSQLTTEQKMGIKRLGPYQPKSSPLVQVCGKTRRTFRSSLPHCYVHSAQLIAIVVFRDTVEIGWITCR